MYKFTPAIRQSLLQDALVDNLLTAQLEPVVAAQASAAVKSAPTRAALAGSEPHAEHAANPTS